MKAVGWVLFVTALFVTAPIAALAVAAYQAKSSCETDLNRAGPLPARPASIVLHIKNENVQAMYNVCVLDQNGANWGRYEFSLGPNGKRTLNWSLPAETFEYRVGFGGVSFGGATHSVTKIDLARCPGQRHEASFLAKSDPAQNKFTLTPVQCDPAKQHDDPAVQAQGAFIGPSGPWSSPPLLYFGLGISGAAYGLWVWRRRAPFSLPLLGFFTRLTQPAVLQHQLRSQIRELVASDPGVHPQAIADRLELSRSVVDYHLGVMCRSGLLTRIELPGQNCFFLRGEYTPHRMRQIAVLRSPSLSHALRVVQEQPGITLTRLASSLNLGPSRASKIAKRLVEAGLVAKSLQNRRAVFRALG